jgi:hypothetical protein
MIMCCTKTALTTNRLNCDSFFVTFLFTKYALRPIKWSSHWAGLYTNRFCCSHWATGRGIHLCFNWFKFFTLFLFCVEFKIVLYQFLYQCGHFNLSLIANQTISDSFLEMCSPVTFAHSLSKKSQMVSSWKSTI